MKQIFPGGGGGQSIVFPEGNLVNLVIHRAISTIIQLVLFSSYYLLQNMIKNKQNLPPAFIRNVFLFPGFLVLNSIVPRVIFVFTSLKSNIFKNI